MRRALYAQDFFDPHICGLISSRRSIRRGFLRFQHTLRAFDHVLNPRLNSILPCAVPLFYVDARPPCSATRTVRLPLSVYTHPHRPPRPPPLHWHGRMSADDDYFARHRVEFLYRRAQAGATTEEAGGERGGGGGAARLSRKGESFWDQAIREW